jgi:L-lactate dehydrogenase
VPSLFTGRFPVTRAPRFLPCYTGSGIPALGEAPALVHRVCLAAEVVRCAMANQHTTKVGIIGAGSVGATIAYACMIRSVCGRIAIYDVAREKVDAETLDLNHGLQFAPMSAIEGSDDVEVLAGSDVVVMTAGAKQRPGQTRIDLAEANTAICRKVLPLIHRVAPNATLLMVTNPVDVLTSVAHALAGLPGNRILGSGTVLDSSRFRFLLAQHCNVAVQSVHAYIVGEHGDSELPLWSSANISGIPIANWEVPGHGRITADDRLSIFENVKTAAYQIIKGKGVTNYAVGLAVAEILEALLQSECRVLPISSMLSGYRGISGVCLSVPCVLNCQGVEAPLTVPMDDDEERSLQASAERIQSVVRSLDF